MENGFTIELIVDFGKSPIFGKTYKLPSDMSLSLQTQISLEQLYSLLAQLPKQEKILVSKRLRAEVALEQWLALSKTLPDLPEIGMDEIISEVKATRKIRQGKP